jgi:hypothetical protein
MGMIWEVLCSAEYDDMRLHGWMHDQMHSVYESLTYTLSLGVMGEMGSTMVGVFTPFLLERAPPIEGKGT